MFQSIFNRPGGCEWQRCSAIVEMAEGTGERNLGLQDQVEFHQVCRRPRREIRLPCWVQVRAKENQSHLSKPVNQLCFSHFMLPNSRETRLSQVTVA